MRQLFSKLRLCANLKASRSIASPWRYDAAARRPLQLANLRRLAILHYRSAFGALTSCPALQAQSFRTPTYTETDVNGGGFGLTYNARKRLRGKLAWAHDWITDPSLAALFQALPGASFIVNGATPAKDSALASAGAELRGGGGGSTKHRPWLTAFQGSPGTFCPGTGGLRSVPN
jgi:hypothetical protein